MALGFYIILIIHFSYFKILATNPIATQPTQQDVESMATYEVTFIDKLISTFDCIQLMALFVLLAFSTFIGLILAIYRIYFRKKQTNGGLESSNSKYKPVVCIHGLFSSAKAMGFFADVIRKNHLGTSVIVLHVYEHIRSLKPLWEQIDAMRIIIENICKEHPGGINLIGLSQGALLARGVIETSDKHNIDTFISVGGPQMGEFGIPLVDGCPGYSFIVKNVFRCFYTKCFQNFSVPEFWKDPYHLSLYEETDIFLPKLNNEIKHPDSERFKTNFSRLNHLVLIGGPDDGFVFPWQSSHFGYLDKDGNIVEMKDQTVYKNDLFGLRTLDEKKAVTVYSIPNVAHYFYLYSVPIIKQYILPHLN